MPPQVVLGGIADIEGYIFQKTSYHRRSVQMSACKISHLNGLTIGKQSSPINIKFSAQLVDDLLKIASSAVSGERSVPVSLPYLAVFVALPDILNLAIITRSVVAIQPSYPIIDLLE